jgi:hypothetical protein
MCVGTFWVVIISSLEGVFQDFGGMYYILLQGTYYQSPQ